MRSTGALAKMPTAKRVSPKSLTKLAGGGLSALGYRFSKADIGVRCVDGSFVVASGDQICPWFDDTARRLAPLTGNVGR
jgi:hypothetical protein